MTGPTYPLPPVCACGQTKADCESSPFCPMTDAELAAEISRLETLDCECEGYCDQDGPRIERRCQRCRDLIDATDERDLRRQATNDEWIAWNLFARKETP